MRPVGSWLASLWRDQDGMTVVEYALLLALVFIASVAAWGTLGGTKMRMTANAVATFINTQP